MDQELSGDRRRREYPLGEGNIEYDETGQLYTVETFRSLTGKLMERHSDKICAMAMIHISGGVEQMAGPGSRPGQRVQDFLGAAYERSKLYDPAFTTEFREATQ